MAGGLSIQVDAREVRNAMHKAPGVVRSGLTKWVNRTAALSERTAKTNVPPHVDTGRLENSISIDRSGTLSAAVKPHAKYAVFVHEGRRPGRMPPFQPGTELNRWATKRGMNPFLVARSIGRKGTKPHKFMDKTYRTVKPLAERDASRTVEEIVRSI